MTDQYRIIRDAPSPADEFEGASHERSAASLVVAIDHVIGTDGAIGLEGPWGSGKSTIIGLAEKRLAAAGNKRRFFTFDLWVHQPELLKLAFLEEFVAWAKSQKLIGHTSAEKYRDAISDREVTTRIENRRKFSWHAIVFVLIAPLLPLAYAWLSPLSASAASANRDPFFALWTFEVYGWHLALLILGAVYLLFLLSALSGLVSRREKTVLAALSSATRVFTKETDHDKITQSIRERNPTSEAFQSFFRRILSEIQSDGTRVILVFDNIDRLPSETVAKVWSETRSIFSMRSRGEDLPNSAVLAIVPFDAAHIADVFEEGPDGRQTDHLLRKTFEITLRVAPPLSTDWRKFLNKKIDAIFSGKLLDGDGYRLFKLLDLEHQERRELPTPRGIVAYVNDIAAYKNQWQNLIPLPHIALYVLRRRQIERDVGTLRTGTAVSTRQAAVVGEGWQRSLAALHFNVEPTHAYQVLLDQEIERAAISDDPREFLEISGSNGFAEVFPDIIVRKVSQWVSEGPEIAAKLSRNLSGASGEYMPEALAQLADALGEVPDAVTSDPEAYSGFATLVSKLPVERATSLSSDLIDWFTRSLPPADQRTVVDGADWYGFFTSIVSELEKKLVPEALDYLISEKKVPRGAHFGLGVYSSTTGQRYLSKLNRQEPDYAFVAAAVQVVGDDPALLKRIAENGASFFAGSALQPVTDAICARLQSNQLEPEVRSALVSLLMWIRAKGDRDERSRSRIEQQVADGTLIWHAVKAVEAADDDTAGAAVWLTLDTTDGRHPPNTVDNHPHFSSLVSTFQTYSEILIQPDPSSRIVGRIANAAVDSSSFNDWLVWSDEKRQPFHASVLRRLIEDGEFDHLVLEEVARRYDALKEIVGDELTLKFLSKFVEWSGHFADDFDGTNCLTITPLLLRDAGKVEGLAGLARCVDEYLDGLDHSEWNDVLTGKSKRGLDFLLVRIDQGYRPRSNAYVEALREHALGVLDGSVRSVPVEDRWPLLFDGLQTHTREKFGHDIMIDLEKVTTTAQSASYFVKVASTLASQLPFREFPGTTVDQLLTRWVSSTSADSDAFIDAHAAELTACYKSASKDVKGRLVEALVSVRHGSEEEERRAVALAHKLGISLPERDAP